MPVPSYGRTVGIVIRIDCRISAHWRTVKEGGGEPGRVGEWVALEREPPLGPNPRGSVVVFSLVWFYNNVQGENWTQVRKSFHFPECSFPIHPKRTGTHLGGPKAAIGRDPFLAHIVPLSVEARLGVRLQPMGALVPRQRAPRVDAEHHLLQSDHFLLHIWRPVVQAAGSAPFEIASKFEFQYPNTKY
jgi:hypothetical protein